jgi:hypothetical protein
MAVGELKQILHSVSVILLSLGTTAFVSFWVELTRLYPKMILKGAGGYVRSIGSGGNGPMV